jgi:serine/threonine-protein phosphatase 5
MIETQKARELAKNKAIKLKDEGNQMMKEGKFKKAIRLYSEAIEDYRGMMVLYSNRALAYIKVEEYDVIIFQIIKLLFELNQIFI